MEHRRHKRSFADLHESDTPTQISIPEDLLMNEILVRLPVKSLLCFKSVCKSWRSYIDSPSFIERHSATTTATERRRYLVHYRYPKQHPSDLHVLMLRDRQATHFEGSPSFNGQLDANTVQHWRNSNVRHFFTCLWGPINGLYCVTLAPKYSIDRLLCFEALALWNPGIRQFHVLPPLPNPASAPAIFIPDKRDSFYGFGFDSTANDYKVVAISYYGNKGLGFAKVPYCFHVYSLATNTWKQVDPFRQSVTYPFVMIKADREGPAYSSMFVNFFIQFHFNGACHWHFYDKDEDKLIQGIISFHLGNEVFQVYKIPIAVVSIRRPIITSVRGCLAMIFMIEKLRVIDVWVMREYGVEESWTKAYSVPVKSSLEEPSLRGVVDDELFVEHGNGRLSSYRLHDQEWRGCIFSECCEYCCRCPVPQVLQYHESLVPVKPKVLN